MELAKGLGFRGKTIREVRKLSNGWTLIKTDDGKSADDFRVRLVMTLHPRPRSITPKHAHFLIDFYGKKCADDARAEILFRGLIRVWAREDVDNVLDEIQPQVTDLPGYPAEYILRALAWILDQEDVNFNGRPDSKQRELDEFIRQAGVPPTIRRPGSELAISLFCNVRGGMHPVEAFLKAQLDVIPVKRARGAV